MNNTVNPTKSNSVAPTTGDYVKAIIRNKLCLTVNLLTGNKPKPPIVY